MNKTVRITLVLALIAVLAFGPSIGAVEAEKACSLAEDADIVRHFERYGGGCEPGDETYITFPEGQQIDQIGEPPWTPL
ncbi:hypothetical protein [Haladaptatus halobius]|uniref:hypothetical protein n=1 Tax=Haladaptatus halobius TaxID=2884875 RepID=UPI001D09C84C|nr:hypothetical protein [Haladaptatus halobius]